MLLQQEVGDGVDVLSVSGPVAGPDARHLVAAVDTALERMSRGVVVDLREVTSVEPEAVLALRALVTREPGPLRPSLLLCAAPPEVEQALPGVDVHPTREHALARLDEHGRTRSAGPDEHGRTRSAGPDEHGRTRSAGRIEHGGTRSVVSIEHGPHGPAQARRAVADCAGQLGLAEEGHDLVLLVSELVTNAVRHGAPPVSLEVEYDDEQVVVAVGDGSAQSPEPRTADTDDENGRGMALVELLAAEHGVRSDPPGKTVWAAVRRCR